MSWPNCSVRMPATRLHLQHAINQLIEQMSFVGQEKQCMLQQLPIRVYLRLKSNGLRLLSE